MIPTISRRAALVAAALLPLAASAQGTDPATAPFPTHAVRLVVPFPPGGATDALARQIAEKLTLLWKQPVLVDNRPGGNTMIGTEAVARAPADGHTLGIVTGSHVINPLLTAKMPYDTLRDLTGVMLLTGFQMALYAHPSFPANNPAELIALAKKEPGRVAYGSATTQSYLGMERLNAMAGTKMQYVPYKGSAQALTDVLGGHTQLMIDPVLQSTVDHAKNGKLKVIAVLGSQPSPLTPGVPLMSTAVPGYDYSGAFGLVARAGTPPALIRRIRDDFAAVLRQPEVAARVREIGQETIASTPEEYNAYILAEMKKWEPIIKATGARLD
ncbi:tripartite tricarboxylate transporter substrate binding protein [Caenimonas terrae]|uniref:Tripartite tricarboxylate transporter substrate binding protein n=1 Tax=Caenimonas terrae TaxID=696074 RepID=A0ABW0N9B4_9BURK